MARKIYHYAEEAIVTWAAGKLRRPVKWTAERTESFMSDAHGRDHVSTAEMALDEEGHFLALRMKTLANMGAYLSTFAPCVPTYLYATLLAGIYKTPVIYCEVKAVFTNTVPVDAYRGAGRPEATFLLERLVDAIAHDTGIDRVEIRRKNFIPVDAFPYQTPVALQYDSGDYQTTLKVGAERADWDGFEARRAAAKARGKLRGIGMSTYLEACGIAPSAVVGSLGARAGLTRSPISACIPPAASPSSPARTATARAMKRPLPSSSSSSSVFRSIRSRSCMAIPRRSRSAWAPTAAAAWRWAARRW